MALSKDVREKESCSMPDDISLHDLDKRLALLEQKFDVMSGSVQKIADALAWFAKLTGAGVLGAITSWILKGGLSG